MGKQTKVTKKVVGSANGSAARGEEADGSTEEFTVAGMGLQGLPAAAGECSSAESMVAGDVAPLALSTLDDGGSQLIAVHPGSKVEDEEGSIFGVLKNS